MIKYKLQAEKELEVVIDTHMEISGDVVVTLNGHELLTFNTKGKIILCGWHSDQFEKHFPGLQYEEEEPQGMDEVWVHPKVRSYSKRNT